MPQTIGQLDDHFSDEESAADLLDDDRLRREVTAKRAVVELHSEPAPVDREYPMSGGPGKTCNECGQEWSDDYGCRTVQALAVAYERDSGPSRPWIPMSRRRQAE
jgi:hypothetical protein